MLQELPKHLVATVTNPSRRIPLQDTLLEQHTVPSREEITEVSPHSSINSVHEYQVTPKHTDGGGIYHHTREETRQ